MTESRVSCPIKGLLGWTGLVDGTESLGPGPGGGEWRVAVCACSRARSDHEAARDGGRRAAAEMAQAVSVLRLAGRSKTAVQ